MKRLTLIVTTLILITGTACPQYFFGQNKVQYEKFDWQVMKTDHFDIYFYPEEEEIAGIGARLAEESYAYLAEKFNHVIGKKIPLIIYSHPSYFSQTNVVPDLLPENVAGFTEFFKERVVIPFDGSLRDFDHVIRHELVHVFMMEKITYNAKSHGRRNPVMPPLWFTEGIAEYWSEGWNNQADMILRDMVISGRIVGFDRLAGISGTYTMYKVGQSILRYLSTTFGDDRITLMFENWWKAQTFAQLCEITFGKPFAEIGRDWEYHLKKTYYPEFEHKDLPAKIAARLTRKYYNIKPTAFSLEEKDGRKDFIAFKTIRLGYSNIAMMPLEGEKAGFRQLVKGERSARFESLHFVDSDIDAGVDGRIAFASKSKESDILYIFDPKGKKLVFSRRFEQLSAISSPAWSFDQKMIAFSGTGKDGTNDIYVYHFDNDSLARLFDDIYNDQSPAFSPDGKYIVFSSDRDNMYGADLYAFSRQSGTIIKLTSGNSSSFSPSWANQHDSIVFTNDESGSPDIYILEHPLSDNPRLFRLTNLATGAYDPSFSANDSAIVFSGYQEMSYHIYKLVPDTAAEQIAHQPGRVWEQADGWRPERITGEHLAGKMKYKTKLSFDIAQSALSYDAIFGTVGGLQGALTDVLGDHQYYLLLYNTGDSRHNLLRSTNAAVTYVNRQRRLNWGFGVYRFFNDYDDDYYGYVEEETYGGVALASYPFSRFDRAEASLYVRKYFKQTLRSNDPGATVATPVLSYIKDTSIWEPSGPIDGFRLRVSLASSIEIPKLRYYNSAVTVDIRKYFRISESSAYALRTVYLGSDGQDPQRHYLGGSWDLRGYPRRSFYDKNILLINNELRFPLVDRLLIGMPIGALSFQAIRGALFVDAAKIWGDINRPWIGSFGFGARVSLGYLTVLRFDLSKRADDKDVYGHGFDFDFFFGWNY